MNSKRIFFIGIMTIWVLAGIPKVGSADLDINFGPLPAGDPSEFTGPLIGEDFCSGFY
jgi:hypothetical protein